MSKIAIITGITGMDGSYLTELLLDKGYIVHGLIRRSSLINTQRIDHLYKDPHDPNAKLFLHYGDMSDACCLERLVSSIKPDEVYNLAAMSHVRVSFDSPEYTGDIDGLGVTRLLEACRTQSKQIKVYQAGTSELYGGVYDKPQNEDTPFYPRSPYAVAKLYAYWMVKNYREAYGMFAVNGVLFNHTSPRRGETFVEQKIVKGAVAIYLGKQDCLYLGNLYTYRDIGHSKDYVYAMWKMLQMPSPDDYVIATGKKYLIKDVVDKVFKILDMKLEWSGEGENEVAKVNGKIVIKIDPRYYRPSEVESLHGDPSYAMKKLDWSHKYDIDSIIDEMVKHEINIIQTKI
jgi:GDPmannose 4,6-dehydratase